MCLKVLPGFEGMITTSPSEPILSEAAYHVMSRLDMDAPKALQEVMRGFAVNRGDRGEFVVMLLLTLARDRAVAKNTSSEHPTESPRVIRVLDFLEHLFHKSIVSELPSDVRPKSQSPGIALGDAFANAQMHFNHFIKVHQHCVVNRKYLLWLMFRGAAVLCGNNQAGIDGVIPFVYRDNRLRADNIGVILLAIKERRLIRVRTCSETLPHYGSFRPGNIRSDRHQRASHSCHSNRFRYGCQNAIIICFPAEGNDGVMYGIRYLVCWPFI